MRFLQTARDERGRKGDLASVASLKRWHADPTRLPERSARPDDRVRAWHAPFFALTDRWQKPTLKLCHEQLLATWRDAWADPAGSEPPSYDACVRAYKRRPEIDKIKGRNSGTGLRALTHYTERDWSVYPPFEEVHSDGWHTHALVPRDSDGVWAAMELWHAICVSTKVVPPFAFAWSEHTDVIAEHLREVIRMGGVPARWQTDSTGAVRKRSVSGRKAGSKSNRIADDDTESLDSLAGRLGVTVLHPQEVGNSRANGMAENFNTWLDKECRALATYMNPDRHDEGGFLRVRRLTKQLTAARGNAEREAELRAELARVGKGYVFTSEADARAWFAALADKWNRKPHRSLPRTRDAATGRQRHMTPLEALDAAAAAGWEAKRLTEAQLADAFRAHLRKTVRRGVVTLHNGQRYFAVELASFEGHDVLAVPHEGDATQVWIKDLQGRLLCVAKLAEALRGRVETTEEHSLRKRAEAQIRAREQQIDQIEARLAASTAIEHVSGATALPGVFSQAHPAGVIEVTARVLPEPAPAQPAPMSLYDMALAEVRQREADAEARAAREWDEAMAERARREARWAEMEAQAQRQREAENAAIAAEMARRRAERERAEAEAAARAERDRAEWLAEVARAKAAKAGAASPADGAPTAFDRAVGA